MYNPHPGVAETLSGGTHNQVLTLHIRRTPAPACRQGQAPRKNDPLIFLRIIRPHVFSS